MFFDKKLHITATGKHEFHVTHGKENSPLNASVAPHTETIHLICYANQVTGFHEGNTGI